MGKWIQKEHLEWSLALCAEIDDDLGCMGVP